MELFYSSLEKVLTLSELIKLSNDNIIEDQPEYSNASLNSQHAIELINYIEFLNTIPKLKHFIKCFDSKPFDTHLALDSLKLEYPNNPNRARKDMAELNKVAESDIKFKGWEVILTSGTETQIINSSGKILLFDCYSNGKNPYVLFDGTTVKSYLHLVEFLGLELFYK